MFLRNCVLGPFSTFAIKDENCTSVPFTSMKFSYDGQKILAVNTSNVYVLEAFHGQVMLKVNVGKSLFKNHLISLLLRYTGRWFTTRGVVHS